MESIVYQHLLSEYKDDVIKQLEALVKVSKRVGVPAPKWTLGPDYEYEFDALIQKGYDEDEYEHFIEKVFDVTIEIEQSIKMEGGWKLAAALIHETESIIQIDVDVEIPGRFSPKVGVCEHCGRSYARVKSFLIVNEAGEWKQIGKSCLKQFLGINPTSYISMFEAFSKFSNYIEATGYGKNRGGRMENLAYNVEDMLRYTIGQVQRDGEFVKAEWKDEIYGYDWRGDPKYKKVRANEPHATVDKVKQIISANTKFKFYPEQLTQAERLSEDVSFYENEMNRLDEFQKQSHDAWWNLRQSYKASPKIGISEDDVMKEVDKFPDVIEALSASQEAYATFAEARETYFLKVAHNWYLCGLGDLQAHGDIVRQVLEWAASLEPKMVKDELDGDEYFASGYESFKAAIKDTFSKKRILQTNLKYVCSGYNTFTIDMIRRVENAERLAKAATLKHVGVVGEKMHLKLKVVGHKSGSGSYGLWNLWTMEDMEGNQFKKFGVIDEKFVVERPEGVEGLVGCIIEALFEIKSHDVYNEEKQTALGRLSKLKSSKKTKS